ncbi:MULTISPECIES: hypothetical protein [Rhizobium]|nr:MULTISPECIES: hypothetical protein [Rhizobium]MCS0460396.1 hypothetical protein [Rhizobium favelukesii]UFS80800.1 hypothetical protein LPB79_20820 [Rhizobium sp. T136]
MAARALLTWPKGLAELADGQSVIRDDTRMLRYLQADASLSTQVRAEIKAILNVRTRKMALTVFQGMENPPSSSSAVTPNAPKRNARTSMMELINRPGHVRSRAEVAVRVVRDIGSARCISRYLGAPVPDVVDLYLSGLLCSLRVEISILGIDPAIQEKEINIIEWMEDKLPYAKEPKGHRLAAAKFALDPKHSLSWSAVLHAALRGDLGLQRGPLSERGFLHDLYVENVNHLETLSHLPSSADRFADVSITSTELAMTLGKSRTVAANLAKHFQWHGATTLRKVTDLRQSYAFGFELAALCSIRGFTVPEIFSVLDRARVPRVNIDKMSLWDRGVALSCLGLYP